MITDVMEQETVDTLLIRKETEIAAPIELSFEAVLEQLGPQCQTPDGSSLQMKFEPWSGGRWYRDLGNNAGHLWGHVQVIKPPTLIEICGPLMMSYPAANFVQYRLTTEGAGSRVTILHRGIGLILPEHRTSMPKGWEHFAKRFREIAEQKAVGAKQKR